MGISTHTYSDGPAARHGRESWGTAPNPRLRAAALNNPALAGSLESPNPRLRAAALNNHALVDSMELARPAQSYRCLLRRYICCWVTRSLCLPGQYGRYRHRCVWR